MNKGVLQIFVLGKPRCSLNGLDIPFPSGKAGELLLRLAIQESISLNELEKLLGCDLRFVLKEPGLEKFLPFIEQSNANVLLLAQTDVKAYVQNKNNLRELAKLRGVFATHFEPTSQFFSVWLEQSRSELRCILLSALLSHARKLESQKRLPESLANQKYVEKDLLAANPIHAFAVHRVLANHHWVRNEIAECVKQLQFAIRLGQNSTEEPIHFAETKVNLGAALTRLGCMNEALEILKTIDQNLPDSFGWALLHMANAHRFLGNFLAAKEHSLAAFKIAKKESDGDLAVAAICLEAEVLLTEAKQKQTQTAEPDLAKPALIAFGRALGIAEGLGDAASIGPLAGLCEAHALWGNKQKALELGERAYKRARVENDAVAATRALLALFATTKIQSFAQNAYAESKLANHKPFELMALVAIAKKHGGFDRSLHNHARSLAMDWLYPNQQS